MAQLISNQALSGVTGYSESTLAATFTGPFASGQALTCVVRQIGKLVNIEVPAALASPAAAATAIAATIVPAAQRPTASIFCPVIITSNALILPAAGRCEVDTSGNIKISADLLGTLAWLAVGNNGWNRFSISYSLA